MFQAQSTHHQEVDVNCTYAASGIVTLCKWPSCATAKEGLNAEEMQLLKYGLNYSIERPAYQPTPPASQQKRNML